MEGRLRQSTGPSQSLALGFVLALLLIGLNMLIAYRSVELLIDGNRDEARHGRAVEALRLVLMNLRTAESHQHGYLLTASPAYRAGFERSRADLSALRGRLKTLELTPAAAVLLPELENLLERRLQLARQSLALFAAGQKSQSMSLIHSGLGQLDSTRIEALIQQMIQRESALIRRSSREADLNAGYALLTLILASLANLLLLLLVYRMFSRQILQRQRSEAELRESETRKSAILATSLDCIIGLDPDARVIEWNPAAEQTFGYARTEALGRPLIELIVPRHQQETHYAGLLRFLDAGQAQMLGQRMEVLAQRRDG
ncbi:MAG: hypothetical protein CVV27_17730, partial [Candidatus Melainabacteria bacterium HGW-Melainabacteria-1]